jgi:subtilisin family serine protease
MSIPIITGNIIVFEPYLTIKQVNCYIRKFSKKYNLPVIKRYYSIFKGFATTPITPKTKDNLWANYYEVILKILNNYPANISTYTEQWNMPRINIQRPSTSTTYSNVGFFVLDTGVTVINNNMKIIENKTFLTSSEKTTNDLNGHGTFVASIIGTTLDQSIYGTLTAAEIYNYKCMNKDGSGSYDDIVDALNAVIDWQNKNQSKRAVINLSLSSYVGNDPSSSLDYAVKQCIAKNIVVVVAAGNNYEDAKYYSPARVSEAMTVGAYDKNNVFATYSNYGSVVDILAPGTDIPGFSITGSVTYLSGTSMSCPHVAGICGLYLLKVNPSASVNTVIEKVKENSNQESNPEITNVPTSTTILSVYSIY